MTFPEIMTEAVLIAFAILVLSKLADFVLDRAQRRSRRGARISL